MTRPDTLIERQSSFQTIRIDRHPYRPGEIVLYCDGMWQLDTSMEAKYHEAIATLPAAAAETLENVLVCGGGDGLSVRSLLQFPEARSVELVEIDPVMIQLFREEPLARFNGRSLSNERVRVHTENAVDFARRSPREFYDLILLDFPSPGRHNADKDYESLFAPAILELFLSLLKPWGVLSAQIGVNTEVMYAWASKALALGYRCWHYDSAYDVRTIDSFGILSKMALGPRRPLPAACKWASPERLAMAFSEVTEVTERELEYYRLFEAGEDAQAGDVFDAHTLAER